MIFRMFGKGKPEREKKVERVSKELENTTKELTKLLKEDNDNIHRAFAAIANGRKKQYD